jgi:hypothetical protein
MSCLSRVSWRHSRQTILSKSRKSPSPIPPHPTSPFFLQELKIYSRDPIFEESRVIAYKDSDPIDKSYRDSSSAYLDEGPDNPMTPAERIIRCVEDRATEFQGYTPNHNLEALQVVKYYPLFYSPLMLDILIPNNSENIPIGSKRSMTIL